MTVIDYYAFAYSGLKSVTIGKGVTKISNDAFYECKYLETIYYNATEVANLSASDNQAFYCAGQSGNGITVVIGKDVTRLPAYLFKSHWDSRYMPKITGVQFEVTEGWSVGTTVLSSEELADASVAANYLTSTYNHKAWTRSV